MSNLAYVTLAQDLIEDLADASISAVNEDADYPIANLKTQPMADTARVSGGAEKIRFDLGANTRVRFWAYLNHNIASGDWTIKTYNDLFITPSGESRDVVYRALDTKSYHKSWTSKRYWEHDFSACTFNDAYLEIGKIVAALDPVFFTANYSPGFGRGIGYESIQNKTEFGVVWTYIKQGPINKVRVKFDPEIVRIIRDELETFFNAVCGRGYPCIIIPDNSGSAEVYYMRSKLDKMDWEEFYNRAVMYGLRLDFEEESRGQTQTA